MRDHRSALYRTLARFQEGSLDKVPAYARSPIIESKRSKAPGMAHRKVMNSLPTLAGLALALSRGAKFGPGPAGTIVAEYDDPNQSIDPQALGEVILLSQRHNIPNIRTHETGHVAQGRYLGPFLPAAAGLTSVVQGLRGKDPYLDNPLETSAARMGEEEIEEYGSETDRAVLAKLLKSRGGP